MGLYRAVGRPLFFAMPPEASHRAARALLALPLPWQRIGGASHDPRLRVTLAGIELANPVGLAAGFDKRCDRLAPLGRLGFGYVVGGTVSRAPRAGNPKPRIARHPASRSITNSLGMPNPGADASAEHLRQAERTAPRFVSLADEAVEDVVANYTLLEPLADAIELNVSSPNSPWRRDRDNAAHLAEILRELPAGRRLRPLFVKLPPFETDGEREMVLAMAQIALEGGANGLTASNTRPVADRRLAGGRGGLSGRALWPGTARIVAEVRKATGGELPVNACGGIFTAEDALTCIEAGATTVQVYTGLIYEGPRIAGNITAGLAAALAARRTSLAAMIAAA